ncbi:Heme-binding protein 2 [Mactra antiquata]
MDKFTVLSMFITFVTSNDVLKFIPHDKSTQNTKPIQWTPPGFCNGLDCPPFIVGNETDEYQERFYAQSTWVSTELLGIDYDKAQYKMFMKLFKYIEGGNKKKMKIAMTCPVTTRIIPGQGAACKSNFTMSFFIAGKVKNPPGPSEDDVRLRPQPALHVYVRSFGGYVHHFDEWREEAEKLIAALEKDGREFEREYYYTAGYNAPFQLFNRHNEIWFIAK